LLDGWFGHTPEAAVIERIENTFASLKSDPETMQVMFCGQPLRLLAYRKSAIAPVTCGWQQLVTRAAGAIAGKSAFSLRLLPGYASL